MKTIFPKYAGSLCALILSLVVATAAFSGESAVTNPAPAATITMTQAKPDPSGANTGGVADVIGATANAPTAEDLQKSATSEPLALKLSDVVGHNRVAINFIWTLICGFLVFFMQAGFAMVETGFTRAKNAAHTMAMNLMVFVFGVLGYWICGYALQMGASVPCRWPGVPVS